MPERTGFYSIMNLAKRLAGYEDEHESQPMPRETPRRGDDQGEEESIKGYELRKAMEATSGGDTRRDRTRE